MRANAVAGTPGHENTPSDLSVALALVATLFFVYLLTYSGVPHSPDEWYFLTGTQAAVDGDFAGIQAHGWLFSLLAAPLYLLPRLAPGIGSYQATSLLNILITDLTALVLFLALRLFDVSQKMRLAVALIYGLATFAWVYGHYLFREPAAGFFLLLAVWAAVGFWRRPRVSVLLAGVLAAACAIAIKQTLLAFVPFLAGLVLAAIGRRWMARMPGPMRSTGWMAGDVSARPNWGRLLVLGVLLGAGAFVCVLTAPWWLQYIPAYAWQTPKFSIFAALWVSPGWGLLSFNPVLLLAVIGAVPFSRRYPAAGFIALGGSLFYVLASTTHPVWWGAWGFGPRQLLPVVPLLSLAIPAGLMWLRSRLGCLGVWFAWILTLVSSSFQLLGGVVPFNEYVRQILFPARIVEQDVTWNWQLWPIAGMARFWRPWLADLVWISGRAEQLVRVRWSVLLPLAGMTLVASAWLVYLLNGRATRVRRRWDVWLSALLLIAVTPVAGWTLHRVYLDERYQPELGYRAAAEAMARDSRPGDVLVTDLWTERPFVMATSLINYCGSDCPPRLDLVRGDLAGSKDDWHAKYGRVLQAYRRVWLSLERLPEGDANSVVEQWLNEIGYLEVCRWQGPQVRLCCYSIAPSCEVKQQPINARLNEQIMLHGVTLSLAGESAACSLDAVGGGDVVRLELHWEALIASLSDYVVSVQLWDAGDRLIQVVDRRPGNSFSPTASWQPGIVVADRYALEIPSGAPPGSYRLIVLMYDPKTMQRLPVHLGDGTSADVVPIAEMQIHE